MPHLAKFLRATVLIVIFLLLIGGGIALLSAILRGRIASWESGVLSIGYVLLVGHIARRSVTRSTQPASPLQSRVHRKWPDLLKCALYFLAAMLWVVATSPFANDGVLGELIIIVPAVTLTVFTSFYFGRALYNRLRP